LNVNYKLVYTDIKYKYVEALFKSLTLTTIHLALALDLGCGVSSSPFKALLNKNMDAYCTIKILMLLTNANANVLKSNIDMLIIPFR